VIRLEAYPKLQQRKTVPEKFHAYQTSRAVSIEGSLKERKKPELTIHQPIFSIQLNLSRLKFQ
jgi:hypothetical protein